MTTKAYDAGHRGFDDTCAGCGAQCIELCLCRARDERPPTPPTPAELEQSRQERLTNHERDGRE